MSVDDHQLVADYLVTAKGLRVSFLRVTKVF